MDSKKSLDLVVSNLTAPVRVLLLLEDERVAGEVGRCDEVDLDQHCNYNKYLTSTSSGAYITL